MVVRSEREKIRKIEATAAKCERASAGALTWDRVGLPFSPSSTDEWIPLIYSYF